MTLPDFQKQVEWCQSYFAKMSLEAYTENWGTISPMLSSCAVNFVRFATLTFQSEKRVWPNLTSETLYLNTLPTPCLDMKKQRNKNAHDVFYAQTKFPL